MVVPMGASIVPAGRAWRMPVTPDQPNPCGTYVARGRSQSIECHEYLQFRWHFLALRHDTS
jgi:hypothetical protein